MGHDNFNTRSVSDPEVRGAGHHAHVSAAAVLDEPGEHPSPSTNVAVDDSVIARQSTFKQLASWGGFRRHFKAQDAEAAPDPSPAPAATDAAARMGSTSLDSWKGSPPRIAVSAKVSLT